MRLFMSTLVAGTLLLVSPLMAGGTPVDEPLTSKLSDPIETVLGEGATYKYDAFRLSADNLHLTWFDLAPLANRAFLDGRPGRAYREINESKVVISPNGRRVAYIAGKGYRDHVLVLDGRESRPYRSIDGLAFSPDSRRFAYFGRETDGGWHVIIDGKRHGPYDSGNYALTGDVTDEGARLPAVFTHDSRHTAYAAARDVGRKREWFLVIDGEEGPAYDEPSDTPNIVIATDSPEPRVACTLGRDGRDLVVHNGVETRAHDAVRWPAMSPDGTRLAYFARDGEQGAVYLDGAVVADCDGTDPRFMIFSPDGQRFACIVRRGETWTAIVDGEPGAEYDHAHSPTFSPDSQRFAHGAAFGQHGGTSLVVLDGEEGPDYARVAQLTFSPDSRRFAYRAKVSEAQIMVVVDGNECVAGHHWDDDLASAIVFSPDSRHVAYFRVDGWFDRRIVIDDFCVGPSYALPISPPVFTDGKIEYLTLTDWAKRRVAHISHAFTELKAKGGDR